MQGTYTHVHTHIHVCTRSCTGTPHTPARTRQEVDAIFRISFCCTMMLWLTPNNAHGTPDNSWKMSVLLTLQQSLYLSLKAERLQCRLYFRRHHTKPACPKWPLWAIQHIFSSTLIHFVMKTTCPQRTHFLSPLCGFCRQVPLYTRFHRWPH